MKKLKRIPILLFIFLIISIIGYSGCGSDSGGGGENGQEPTPNATSTVIYNDFNTAVADMVQVNHTFVTAVNALQGANLSSLSSTEIVKILEDLSSSGDAWVDAGNALNAETARVNDLHFSSSSTVKALILANAKDVIDYVPGTDGGLGPGALKDVGNLIQNSQQKLDKLKEQYPEWNEPGSPDSITFRQETIKLAEETRVEGTKVGLQVVVGTVGGVTGTAVGVIIVKLGLLASGPPGWVIIGGCGVIGATVGAVSVTFFSEGSSSSQNIQGVMNATQNDADVPVLVTGLVSQDEPFPIMYPEPGTLTISIPGNVPVILDNFQPPAAGQQFTITPTCTAVDDDNPNEQGTIVIEESEAAASSCADLLGVSAVASPADPAPFQGVTVTATVFPAIAGCSVSYTVTGTDGYNDSGSPKTDSSGQINIFVPGGAEGVNDIVNLESNGKTFNVVYTF